jgi:hypothetical protein
MKTADFAEHFAGFDASLSISLHEYGFIYSYTDPRSKGDLRVWVKYPAHGVFDWADFRKDLDFWKEFDWVKPDSLLSFLGLSKAEFDALPLEQKISDAVSYYGPEEICGTPYNGTKISE